jgi:hypothetical protein
MSMLGILRTGVGDTELSLLEREARGSYLTSRPSEATIAESRS